MVMTETHTDLVYIKLLLQLLNWERTNDVGCKIRFNQISMSYFYPRVLYFPQWVSCFPLSVPQSSNLCPTWSQLTLWYGYVHWSYMLYLWLFIPPLVKTSAENTCVTWQQGKAQVSNMKLTLWQLPLSLCFLCIPWYGALEISQVTLGKPEESYT